MRWTLITQLVQCSLTHFLTISEHDHVSVGRQASGTMYSKVVQRDRYRLLAGLAAGIIAVCVLWLPAMGAQTTNLIGVPTTQGVFCGQPVSFYGDVVYYVDQSQIKSIGTDGNDIIIGTDGNDRIDGGKGADCILVWRVMIFCVENVEKTQYMGGPALIV